MQHAKKAIELGAGAEGHHFLSAAKLYAGDAQGAIDEARKAVGLDPSAKSRTSLGGILLATGRYEDAVAVLKQAVAEAPDNADTRMSMAMAAAKTNDYGEAIVNFARAFELRPGDHRIVQNLMVMFTEAGKWLGAMAALEMSRKGEPPPDVNITLDVVNMHIIRMVTGRFPPAGMTEEADEAARAVVTNAAGRPTAVQLVAARTLLDHDRVDEAKQIIAKIDHAKASAEERALLVYLDGYFAEQAKDVKRALELYDQALAADATRVEAAINATSLLLQDGSAAAMEKIGAMLARVAPAQQSNPNLLYNAAIYHARGGRTAESKAALERILKITGGTGPHAIQARKALDDLQRAPS
jgi:tetratricopeptide (TPR) repeat protein